MKLQQALWMEPDTICCCPYCYHSSCLPLPPYFTQRICLFYPVYFYAFNTLNDEYITIDFRASNLRTVRVAALFNITAMTALRPAGFEEMSISRSKKLSGEYHISLPVDLLPVCFSFVSFLLGCVLRELARFPQPLL